MPTLNWIGKDAVVNHHHQVPFRLLKDVPELACGEPGTGNLIVEGDNLEALKALLPYYAGQVKCIYIDPPYNTGNEGWVYNDNVRSPIIEEWLGKTVGKEGETLDRHDRWLCMMYPRLALLREFLREDGSIWISLDDNEIQALRYVMDEIFGAGNFITSICWHKRVSPANDAHFFSTDHDWIVVYARNWNEWRPNRLVLSEEQEGNYTNPDGDNRGAWNSSAYTCAKTAEERPNLYYPIIQPNTGEEVWPSKNRVWAYDRGTHQRNVAEKRIYWGKEGDSTKPRLKKFLSDAKRVVPRSIWTFKEAGHNQEAKLELLDILPHGGFSTPKPTRLIERILQIATNPGDLVLDSFAGSGTAGHAVLKMNAAEKARTKLTETTEGMPAKSSSPCPPSPPCEPFSGQEVLKINALEEARTQLTEDTEGRPAKPSSPCPPSPPCEPFSGQEVLKINALEEARTQLTEDTEGRPAKPSSPCPPSPPCEPFSGQEVLKMNALEEARTQLTEDTEGRPAKPSSPCPPSPPCEPRRFILVEMEPEIAPKITAERVRRVAEGYKNAKGEEVAGLGGGFRYCRLSEPLFDADRQIRPSVTFGELARHVYFTETGEPLPRERVPNSPLLGVYRGVAIYLLYNGILGDKSTNGGNVLTRAVLSKLPKFDGQKVIYCAGCLLGTDRRNAERIVIRQTPYEIKVS